MEVITSERVRSILPSRDPNGDKFSFGRVLIVAGSIGYTGAPYFASLSAQMSGCGLVRLIVPESIWAIEATKLNEVIVIPQEDDEDGRLSARALSEILKLANRSDAVLVGPGCGINKGIQTIVKGLLTSLKIPLVIDADAINVLCEDSAILKYASCPTIITPHAKEFARLYGKRIRPSNKTLQDFSIEYDVNIVYKEAETRIATPDNRLIVNKAHGNSGMAKGGSGDVLAGMIASFCAQGLKPIDAAIASVYLHAAAGDLAKAEFGERAMLPSHIIQKLPQTLKMYE